MTAQVKMPLTHYSQIIRTHQKPLRFVLARLLSLTGLCRMFSIQQRGYRLRFYPSNLSEQLWIKPGLREEALEFFRAYLKPGDKVIDVGANIGDTVLTASTCIGSDGQIWAVEPHPRIFRYLKSNLKLNRVQNVEAINSAAGEFSGEIAFTDDRRDDMNRVGDGTLRVPIGQLDDIIECHDTIALLKVDVEGYEKSVLAGAKMILEKTFCLHLEAGRAHFSRFGYQICDLLQLIKSQGFRLFRIASNGFLEEIDAGFDSNVGEDVVGLRSPTDFQERTGWMVKR